MKRSLLLTVLGLVWMAGAAMAQNTGPVRIGIVGGLNLANMTESEADSRAGLIAGLSLIKPINTSFSLVTEAAYSARGAKVRIREDGVPVSASLNVGYIDIPVFIRYQLPVSGEFKPYMQAGPALGLNTGCNVGASGGGVSVTVACSEVGADIRTFDLGAVAGAGLEIDLLRYAVGIGARYNAGLVDVSKDGSGKNRTFQFVGSVAVPIGRR
ncbi:MAG: PorT family protein [Gemmatimonadota bacterium]|jgi:opacity protein-like surface antigen|nr:PorT family protein [Gemmatimonadota bacterium]